MLYLPTPKNISFFWNFGSLLGLCLSIQLISGIILSMFYSNTKDLAFKSVMNFMILENPILSIFQSMHANGASMFFVCLFLHIGRGLYYQSFKLLETWLVGVILFFITMMTAFLGYVLPWGQMSFWGATVITNLLATIPYLGNDLVIWLWGGFSVDNPTLSRFFIFHFLMPFVILLFSLIHLFFLHNTGSSNPLGLNSNLNKIVFSPYFIYKDILTILILISIISLLIIFAPFILGDSDNFIAANPLVTPVHIQPEWYFLFAYAILRSIPNKLGGTIALAFSIAILFFVPFFYKNNKFKSNNFYFLNKLLFWFLSTTVILLTWIGMSPMEFPFILIGQFLTIIYFSLFIFFNLFYKFWESLLN